MVGSHGHKKTIGQFKDVCDWPHVAVETSGKVSDLVATMDIRKVHELKGNKKLIIECGTNDVTLYKSKSDVTCAGSVYTTEDAMVSPRTFNFEDKSKMKKMMLKSLLMVYVSQFASVFLEGANPLLDLAIDGTNAMAYKDMVMAKMAAHGSSPMKAGKKMLKAMKGGDKDGKGGKMIGDKAMMVYGETFGTQMLIDAYNVYLLWNNLVSWNAGNDWSFYNWIQGNMAYNSDFWQLKQFYFDTHTAILETIVFVLLAIEQPKGLVVQWPRTLNSYWRLTNDIFMYQA
jgi:hypothetical protein